MAAPYTNSTTYRDGDAIQCQNCGKPARVKYFSKGGVVILSPTEKIELALRCQSCGFVMCDECAHGGTTAAPLCPACKREWGPYHFIRDALPPESDLANPTAASEPRSRQVSPSDRSGSSALPSTWNKALEQTLQTGFLPVSQSTPEAEIEVERVPRRRVNLKPLLIGLIIVGLVGGIIYLGLHFGPRLWIAFRQLRPTPTSTPLAVTAPLKGLASYEGQNLSLEGFVQSPPEACSEQTADPAWCRVQFIPLVGGDPVVVALQLGKPTNAITTDRHLLTWNGKLVSEGAPVRLSGKVSCPQAGICELQVSQIEALQVILTATPTLTPTVTPTPQPTQAGCTPAGLVTLDDLGKTMCVDGAVLRTSQQDNAFLIWFSDEKNSFYLVLYDRTWKEALPGACVRVTGEIKRLGNAPVIAPRFKDPLELCP